MAPGFVGDHMSAAVIEPVRCSFAPLEEALRYLPGPSQPMSPIVCRADTTQRKLISLNRRSSACRFARLS